MIGGGGCGCGVGSSDALCETTRRPGTAVSSGIAEWSERRVGWWSSHPNSAASEQPAVEDSRQVEQGVTFEGEGSEGGG